MRNIRYSALLALVLMVTVPAGLSSAQVGGMGTAVIWDNAALGDAISYSFDGVPDPGEGWVYEGWLITDDGVGKLNTGVMTLNADCSINHTYTSPEGQNLLDNYGQVVVTVEPVPDPDPNPSGIVAASHIVPADAMAHIRHLLTNWPPNTDKGILTNLKAQLDVAILHANLSKNSTTLDAVILHAHHVINVIEGAEGSNYDASFGDPGDGVGVLNHAGDRKHAGFSAGQAPDDSTISGHAALVEAYGKMSRTGLPRQGTKPFKC